MSKKIFIRGRLDEQKSKMFLSQRCCLILAGFIHLFNIFTWLTKYSSKLVSSTYVSMIGWTGWLILDCVENKLLFQEGCVLIVFVMKIHTTSRYICADISQHVWDNKTQGYINRFSALEGCGPLIAWSPVSSHTNKLSRQVLHSNTVASTVELR